MNITAIAFDSNSRILTYEIDKKLETFKIGFSTKELFTKLQVSSYPIKTKSGRRIYYSVNDSKTLYL